MIGAARKRAEQDGSPARFIRANAQVHAFEPATVDTIISRFGVMFFDDPVVVFRNLRRATRSDAELRFIAWRIARENRFMTTAEHAAAPLLPTLPVSRPNDPESASWLNRAERIFGLGDRVSPCPLELGRKPDQTARFPSFL